MEHVELINRIIEAENEAQRIAGDARDKLIALPAELQEKTEIVHQEMRRRAENRVEQVRKHEEQWADERVAALNAQLAEELAALERMFAERRQQWADHMLAMVIGR